MLRLNIVGQIPCRLLSGRSARLINAGLYLPVMCPPRMALFPRYLSQSTDAEKQTMSSFEKAKFYTAKYGLYAGVGTVAAYGIGKSLLYVSTTFLGFTLYDVGWYMFYAGIITGTGAATTVSVLFEKLHIRPESVRNEAFDMVAASPDVRDKMGVSMIYPLHPGVMRAYTKEGGHFSIDSISRSLVWRKPRIKMIFQVYGGDNHQAVVSLEAEKALTKLKYTLLTVDMLTKDENLLLIGSESKMEEKDQLRSLVQLNKKYV